MTFEAPIFQRGSVCPFSEHILHGEKEAFSSSETLPDFLLAESAESLELSPNLI